MARGLRTAITIAMLSVLCACSNSQAKKTPPPIDLTATYAKAAAAYAEQDWTQAHGHYKILSERAPGEAEPWFKLANIYARTQRPQLAIAHYRETLVRDSQHTKAWHNMAIVQLREAGSSFNELEQLVGADDPLHEKSITIQRAIEELIN